MEKSYNGNMSAACAAGKEEPPAFMRASQIGESIWITQ